MNIFYAPPDQVLDNRLELTGQEARHAAKTLRHRRGDEITAVDGRGGRYEGVISRITDHKVTVNITSKQQEEPKLPCVTVAIGIIKKRDRLEFAVEKAAELGAAEIAVFRGEHSVKQNVRRDRLESTAISAMKQSLRSRLPEIMIFHSLEALLQNYSSHRLLAAHKSGHPLTADFQSSGKEYLLLTGPEGDFSDNELELIEERKAQLISLGTNRLRTETAAITFLNSFLLLNEG